MSLDSRSINKSLIPINFQNDLRNIITFNELYQKVNETDKTLKNPLKLSLKQLEVKKKEKLINKDIGGGLRYDSMSGDTYNGFAQHQRGEALYHKPEDNISNKYETMQMYDSSKSPFTYEFYSDQWS